MSDEPRTANLHVRDMTSGRPGERSARRFRIVAEFPRRTDERPGEERCLVWVLNASDDLVRAFADKKGHTEAELVHALGPWNEASNKLRELS